MTPEALDVEFFKFHVKIVEDGSDPRNHLLEPPYFIEEETVLHN